MRKKRTVAAGLLAGILLIVLTGCMGTYSDQKESDDEAAKRGASADTAGAFAADFTLRDQYGVAHRFSDYRGHSVLLVFWATWCPDCMEELPDIEELYRTYQQTEGDMIILGVNTPNREPETDVDGITAFMEKNNYTFPTLMDEDGRVFDAYQIRTYPTVYFIGSDGRIKNCVKEVIHLEEMKRRMKQP